ncbi:MAG TPA: hypothetical protein DEF85_10605 [Clostridiaceae bacterium]|mgnify:CR=1 FL=1|jgi:hypothetical protein|nr:hypothetical protein [Clostridiaceae bacterium]HBF78086.1 hypothetical protein [Clostridiaceae bacterium]HBG37847.1 hypothetical protein [Clostridiaceae bacterium]HBN27824.1 hypothetical protein [Clostridiaceae bacterium]HBX49325.1 hypothetical protein [Clostridiaceae bacterium]
MADIEIKKITYGKYGNCIYLANGSIELVATIDVGPRVIRYGLKNGPNMFCEKNMYDCNDSSWKILGGHRLWHSPEDEKRTYYTDKFSVKFKELKNGIILYQEIEESTKIEKSIELNLTNSNKVIVKHRLTNKNLWNIEFAAWSLSVMERGGIQIIPQAKRKTNLLPNRVISLWPYSKMNDKRVYFGNDFIMIRQDPSVAEPFKIGLSNEEGWAAYFNFNNAFIKKYNHKIGAKYPDFGVSYETYVSDFMMEMESLSPLCLVKPNETLEHIEEWDIIENVNLDFKDENFAGEFEQRYVR